jgi:hypothetical protein
MYRVCDGKQPDVFLTRECRQPLGNRARISGKIRAVKCNLIKLGLRHASKRVAEATPLGFDGDQCFTVGLERNEIGMHDKLTQINSEALVRFERGTTAQ